MPKKKARGWNWPGLQSAGSGYLGLQTAGKMPRTKIGESQVPGLPGEEPPAGARTGPLRQQPAPLGRTPSTPRVCCCVLEVPLVHQVSFRSYEGRLLLLQP